MAKFIDLSGQQFGRWTVLRRAANKGKETMFLCRCSCGREVDVSANNLRNGVSVSCGCYRDEKTLKRSTRHGMSKRGPRRSSEYCSWATMIQRCKNSKMNCYHNYGGRGITVCDRWAKSFDNFYADMGPKPSVDHSIDRIDLNGNYEPSNCRWATRSEQGNNRRNNVKGMINGQVVTATEASNMLGVDSKMVLERIRHGWSFIRALTQPSQFANKGRK